MNRVFICHSTNDKEFVLKVAVLLKSSFIEVFYYEEHQRQENQSEGDSFQTVIDRAQMRCDYMIVFVGDTFGAKPWQEREINVATAKTPVPNICVVDLRSNREPSLPAGAGCLTGLERVDANVLNFESGAVSTAHAIMKRFGLPYKGMDGLPSDTSLFSYEKDIIRFYSEQLPKVSEHESYAEFVKKKFLGGCPQQWPIVTRWTNMNSMPPLPYGSHKFRDDKTVVAAALSSYHQSHSERRCMLDNSLVFPEAGPRKQIYYPSEFSDQTENFRIAILVAGGIAPGINAVIDGIVQRHWEYGKEHGNWPTIYGLMNGLSSFNLRGTHGALRLRPNPLIRLIPNSAAKNDITYEERNQPLLVTSEHAREGGSIIGTAREDDFIFGDDRDTKIRKVVDALVANSIHILYVIGGDGSMKLAHSLWNIANIDPKSGEDKKQMSVVAVPKTMDNDILWVWQAFGFLSAVEKAREVLAHLDTEIKSNPRLCILQLFGSASGFVVSHTVAASGSDQCDVALIPEERFSLFGLAKYLKEKIRGRNMPVPSGLIVMAETAIPTDAIWFIIGGNVRSSEIKTLFTKLRLSTKVLEDYSATGDPTNPNAGLSTDELCQKAADKFLSQRSYIETCMIREGAQVQELYGIGNDISLTENELIAIMRYHVLSYLGLKFPAKQVTN